MTNVKKTIAACAGTVALACAVIQPAKAADMPPYPPQQYGGPPPVQEPYVQERYVYQEPPRAYYRPAPPAVVPVPEPYYVPRRVYVAPGYRPYGYGYGYRAYGYRPYVAGGYGYHRPYYRHW